MKNYLDHEIEVKYMDGILAQSKEWQWFIDCIESTFELSDISNYDEFKKRNAPLRRIMGNLINITEISNKNWTFTQNVLKDLFEIAQFSAGQLSINDCRKRIVTNIGQVFLAIVWLTKLENSDNETNFITDMRFMCQHNFYQAIEMPSFVSEEDEILEFLDSITIDGFENPRSCIKDNLMQIHYGVTEGFIDKYRDNLISVNAFNYQNVQKDEYLTWQEYSLLDMLSVSIEKRTITPTFSNNYTSIPDHSLWTSAVIHQIKNFFNDPAADFVAETIDYIKNGVLPEKKVIETHCRLLKELMENSNDYEVYSSSSFTVIASLFSDSSMTSIEKNGDVLAFIKCVQSINSIPLLLRFREAHFPLSKNQTNTIKRYITEQYKAIGNINDIYQLIDYLSNKDIAKNITQPYYEMIKPMFIKMLDNPRQQLIPTLFYRAMMFLINVDQTNQQVDKHIVKAEMISLQEYWQNHIYAEQLHNLQEFKQSTTFLSKDVDMFNNLLLTNPVLIAQKCLISKTDDLLNAMNSISEHPLLYMFRKMILTPFFPLEGGVINYDNHEIDTLLGKQVDEIKKQYGYKFLNVLETDIYVSSLHERYRELAAITIPLFKEEKKLYDFLETQLETSLIPYDTEIKLGHLTQLFPLLEIQIRKLGKMIGIVPFKEKASEFMKFKDPSSILREILEDVYTELGSFENVSDLLFVYHFMYNGNSLNIRNECIHGRDYISGNRLKYAFKITLLALHMIMYRIIVIKENTPTILANK